MIIEQDVSLYEFYFGGVLNFEHIDGSEIVEEITPLVTVTNDKMKCSRDIQVKHCGLPINDNGKDLGRGDLFIRLNLFLPPNLDNYQDDIKKIFYNSK